jgi:hypothetical protein
MEHILAALALIAIISSFIILIAYTIHKKIHRQECLERAYANYLLEEQHEQWIRDSYNEYNYRDELEDEYHAIKHKDDYNPRDDPKIIKQD